MKRLTFRSGCWSINAACQNGLRPEMTPVALLNEQALENAGRVRTVVYGHIERTVMFVVQSRFR